MFYNVYYGVIGKRCFTPRWRCVSYMEFAPLAPPLYFGLQPTPRSCKGLPHYEVRAETEHRASQPSG